MVLVVVVGALTCGIPVEMVVETMRPLPIVDGVAIVRGERIAVVDCARVLKQHRGAGARFVVVRAVACRIALHVDAVLDLRAADTVEPMPMDALV